MRNNDLREFAKYIKFARKHGLKCLKTAAFEFEFSFPTPPTVGKTKGPQGLPLTEGGERMPSDDEMLLYSTDSYDMVRDQREAAVKEKN